VIAFPMAYCCASCDWFSGAVQAPDVSPWEPESAKAGPRRWRARSLCALPGPSVFAALEK